MLQATIHEAKTHFSKLLRHVALGEEIIILKGSHPVAKIIPIPHHKTRIPGSLQGRFHTPDTFFEPLPPEELAAWEYSP